MAAERGQLRKRKTKRPEKKSARRNTPKTAYKSVEPKETKPKRVKKPFDKKGYIIGALRKIWRWSPERTQILAESIKAANGKPKIGPYKCAMCKLDHKRIKRDDIQVDHIAAVIPEDVGFTTWDSYIERLFCPIEGLRVVCKPCHRIITNKQNAIRRLAKSVKSRDSKK